MPILLAAPGVIAAAHSGWRGTADGMPRASLDAIRRIGSVEARDVRVFMGPCIGPCCYRVGPEVARRFPSDAVRPHDDGPHVDLAAAVRLQLEAAGVRPDAIDDPPACTACHPEWLFSHRRDQGRTGRMWGLITLTS
jgi:copper oxidase (laccase) domain-containing protein